MSRRRSGLAATFAAIASLALACTAGAGNQSGHVRAVALGAVPDVPLARADFDDAQAARCGPHAGPVNGLTELVRFPYLQQVGARSAMVLWTASSRAPYSVDVTLPDGTAVGSFASHVDASAHPSDAFQQVSELSGLEPGRVYCYTLARAGRVLAGPLGLRTAPLPGSGASVSFAAFGDSGDGSRDQQAVFAQLRGVPVDLMLGTGDMAYGSGTLDQLEDTFFSVYEPMLGSIPLYPTPGNHDYKTQDGAPFREVFALPENGGPEGTERWYSFDWGDVHFVGLDRQALGQPQADWLARDLERNTLPWTIVFTHQSPYSSGEHGSSAEFRRLFSPILEQNGVQLVLAGHDHDYERTVPIRGVTYVVTGGGGRGTRAVGESSFTAFSLDVLHFVYVHIEGPELRLYAVDASGEPFDFTRIINPKLT